MIITLTTTFRTFWSILAFVYFGSTVNSRPKENTESRWRFFLIYRIYSKYSNHFRKILTSLLDYLVLYLIRADRMAIILDPDQMLLRSIFIWILTVQILVGVGGGRGVGGGGGGINGIKCGTGVRTSISKPTSFIYMTFEKRTHSYTWSSETLTYSYSALWFLYPFIAGS